MNWLRDFLQDVRYAFRSLQKAPVFTLTAVLTIALGIGVNTAVFNVVANVVLDPLPFLEPSRLVHVAETHPNFPSYQVAAPDFFDWQRLTTSFAGLAAYTFQEMNKAVILGDGAPEPVQMVQASYTLFPLLGVQPLLGRFYTAEEEHEKAPVVLLSESLWRSKYASDPKMIGRKIRIVDFSVTVIGIVPDKQAQPGWGQLWSPLSGLDPALTSTRRFHTLEVIGRLKPGVTVQQADTEMKHVARALAQAYPATNAKTGTAVLPMSLWATGPVRPALLIAWAAAALMLLLACANVAHLVLVRTAERSREIAVRSALGAGEARTARFLLTENLLLATFGGFASVLLATAFLPLISRMADVDVAGLHVSTLAAPSIAFGCAATLLCAGLFALPALVNSRKLDLAAAIKRSAGVQVGHRRSVFGAAVIAAEIAIAFAVIAGASLLYQSFQALLDEKTGFEPRGVLALELPLALDWAQSPKVFEQKVAPRLREIPGVISVAAANCGPMMLEQAEVSRFTTRFAIAGQAISTENLPTAQVRWTTPDYFETLRIALKRGRLFTQTDVGKRGYLINEALAHQFFGHQDPTGRQLVANAGTSNQTAVPILGVVENVRDLGLDVEPTPTIYQLGVSNRMTVLIRATADPALLIPSVRDALGSISPDDAIGRIAPLDHFVQASVARRRFVLQLIAVFAALGALLTAVGVYGVISYLSNQRTREFAIRFALGAETRDVRRLVMRRVAFPTIIGLVAGAWLAFLFASVARAQLYRIAPGDPVVLLASAIMVLLLVLLAGLRPMQKAAGISPVVALRE